MDYTLCMDASLLQEYFFQYYGIDWIVTLTVFIGIFLLGEKKKMGFIVGMISEVFAFVLSFQIKSVANGVTAIILFSLYFRGYVRWVQSEREGRISTQTTPLP